ncbi:MAG: transporter [Alphaproteobacteria bacterium]
MSGDFAMALIGPPGLYLRNDVAYFQGSIKSVTLGDRVYTSASQDVWVNLVKFIYLAERGVLGGRFGAVATVPVVIDATARGTAVSPVQVQASGSRSGVSDVIFTGFLNWSFGTSHVSTGVGVWTPTGSYSAERIVNLGRNYWTVMPTLSYTWLQPERGHEVSFNTGFAFNSPNHATNYRSGNEWAMELLAGQHFSKEFAVGLSGSVLVGITDDSGALLDRANAALRILGLDGLGGFRERYLGLGPAVLWSPTVFGRNLNLVGKYLVDVVHENRFTSSYLVLSAAFRF